MQEIHKRKDYLNGGEKKGITLLPIAVLWAVVSLVVLTLIIINDEGNQVFARPYLFPWSIAAGIVLGAPSVYYLTKHKFYLYHPLVFPACIYFIPSFFIGGLILTFGLNEPYFLTFVQDQETNLPFTMMIIMLGYAGLCAGFLIPYGGSAGRYISRKLPIADWEPDDLLLPGIILLILGFINNIIGFLIGILGYQRLDQVNTYDGLLFMSSLFYIQAAFLLWVVLFRRNKMDFTAVLVGGVLITTALVKALFSGNRGGFLHIFLLILFSYLFAGRIIKFKQGIVLAVILFLVVIIGMVYGTTFRSIKGTEASVGASEYAGYIGDTFGTIGSSDNTKVLEQGFATLTERLEAVSSLAVVVSNYEQMRPYEESYNLDNNIYTDTVTFFIPRVIWKDKPSSSDPRKYGELYFNFGENSFTVTPMGDLLRNFGVAGVPIGMLILGFILRLFYSGLIENQPFSIWRAVLFFMIVPSVSYEGFYGTIIPNIVKTGFISVIGLLFIYFLINKKVKR